jgi:amidase
VTTFILRLDSQGTGPRLAVKDLIDIEGTPTTAGCRAVADAASPAAADAPLMAGARAAGARVVGKANLHELADGGTGLNPWFGDPVNPIDASFIPGGSSSGSAVAVATGEADTAYGSDTAGSVRHPSACCGTAGLKTTYGRISLEGVWPLAPSLDTVGPMGRDVGGVILGMQLLEPGFTVAPTPGRTVGRLRNLGSDADPRLDEAIDRALAEAELEVVDVEIPGWSEVEGDVLTIFMREAWHSDQHLLEMNPAGISEETRGGLEFGAAFEDAALAAALGRRAAWRAAVDGALSRCEVLALPTLPFLTPRIGDIGGLDPRIAAHTARFNFSGHPALALPVPGPAGQPFPASLQLVGPHGGEELLCATGLVVEAAVAR